MNMISKKIIREAAYQATRSSCIKLPADVKRAYEDAAKKETGKIAKYFLEKYLENISLSEERGWPLCADPGTPRWFVKVGENADFEGKFISLENILREAIVDVTKDVGIRPNVCDPINRWNSGTNIGPRIPPIDYSFEPEVDWIELTISWKGGVSGNDYRLGMPVDGVTGIKRAVLDCVIPTLKEGHQCPPHIVGVGLGGTKDYSMRLAKEAAILRPVGDRHPNPDIASLELDLLSLINNLGFGAAGLPGMTAAFDVHIEVAYTHTMGMPVGVTNHCGCVRRATVRINSDDRAEFRSSPEWFTKYLRGM